MRKLFSSHSKGVASSPGEAGVSSLLRGVVSLWRDLITVQACFE